MIFIYVQGSDIENNAQILVYNYNKDHKVYKYRIIRILAFKLEYSSLVYVTARQI